MQRSFQPFRLHAGTGNCKQLVLYVKFVRFFTLKIVTSQENCLSLTSPDGWACEKKLICKSFFFFILQLPTQYYMALVWERQPQIYLQNLVIVPFKRFLLHEKCLLLSHPCSSTLLLLWFLLDKPYIMVTSILGWNGGGKSTRSEFQNSYFSKSAANLAKLYLCCFTGQWEKVVIRFTVFHWKEVFMTDPFA